METLQAFGLSWRSAELAIPELPAGGDGPLIDVAPDDPQHWPPLAPGPHDTPFVQMAPGELRLAVEGIGRFRVSGGSRISWWREHEGVSDQDLRTFLLGSPVGALLIQRRMLVLHGDALEKEGQAIVCLGHTGDGKSTLAYALMQQGWRLLADDLVAISPEGLVLPGIPRIKLWHDAAQAFGLDPGTLPPVRQGMHKGLLVGKAVRRCSQAVPLRALYLMQHRDASLCGSTPPISRITSQKEAALRLRNLAFRPRFIRGLGQEGRSFLALAELQRQVPLASLRLPPRIQEMQQWLQRQNLLTAASAAAAAAEAETGSEPVAAVPA